MWTIEASGQRQLALTSSTQLGITYLWIINADYYYCAGCDLLDSIQVTHRIDNIHGAVQLATGARLPQAASLHFLHAGSAPLVKKPLLIIASGRSIGWGGVLEECSVIVDGFVVVGAIETSDAEKGSAEGALASTLKGLGIGDDTLGASVGVVDGVGDAIAAGVAGVHGRGSVFGVGELGFVVVRGFVRGVNRVVVTVLRMRRELLPVDVYELVELVLSR